MVPVLLLSAVGMAQELAPPKEITDLGWMVGTWSGSGKIAFGGTETPIETKMTVSLDGQFLKAVSSDKSNGFTLLKTTMISWDVSKHEYVSYSFTNIGATARVENRKFEDGKLVMVSDPWESEGMKSVIRESLWKVSSKKFGLSMEFKFGEKWVKGLEMVLSKQ